MDQEKKTRNCGPRVDLTGKTFGYLTVMYYVKGGKWHCKCKCGKEIDVDTRNLNSSHTKSCGCLLKKHNQTYIKDMVGFENEGVKVLEFAGTTKDQVALWKCQCKYCNRIFIARGSSLRKGTTRSCGCVHSYNERKITKMFQDNNINFIAQYTFPDLIGCNGGYLRFDFAVFKNNKLHHLIEYNGCQHYTRPEGSWSKDYDSLVENDQRKIQYCKDHNIELRIIKYDQSYTLDDLI